MSAKNKQYKIEKGLLLFTQPRSPYFYGKIRLNRKYVTKSFAPITDLEEAKIMLFEWRKELLSQSTIPTSTITSPENFKSRSEYVEHVPLANDFQFLEVGRYDPNKKNIEERKINFVEIYGDYNQSDFKDGFEKEGIQKFLRIVEHLKNFTIVQFGWHDIVRSDFLRDYIMAKEFLGYR